MHSKSLENVIECLCKIARDEGTSLENVTVLLHNAYDEQKSEASKKFAKKLSRSEASNILGHAMDTLWDQSKIDELEAALVEKFPTHKRTISKLLEAAGDASNERYEREESVDFGGGFYDRFSRVAWRLLRKLPWEKEKKNK